MSTNIATEKVKRVRRTKEQIAADLLKERKIKEEKEKSAQLKASLTKTVNNTTGIIVYNIDISKNDKRLSVRQFYLNTSPTGNCQLSCVNTFANILHDCITIEGTYPHREMLKLFIEDYINRGHKTLLLMDINQQYVPAILQNFKPEGIVLNSPYNSSNGSKMCIMIIKPKHFIK